VPNRPTKCDLNRTGHSVTRDRKIQLFEPFLFGISLTKSYLLVLGLGSALLAPDHSTSSLSRKPDLRPWGNSGFLINSAPIAGQLDSYLPLSWAFTKVIATHKLIPSPLESQWDPEAVRYPQQPRRRVVPVEYAVYVAVSNVSFVRCKANQGSQLS